MNAIRLQIQTSAEHFAGKPLIEGNPPADDATDVLGVIRTGVSQSGQPVLALCLRSPWQVDRKDGVTVDGPWVTCTITRDMMVAMLAAMNGAQAREQRPSRG